MNENDSKFTLITPVHNEIKNLPNFFKALENLSSKIFSLIIVENNSTDGSKDFLKAIKTPKNITNYHLIEHDFEDKSYDLEFKYAKIIDIGLKQLKSFSYYNEIDYVGILDSDVFPEKTYYTKLINFLHSDSSLGITSGLIYTHENKLHISNQNWVRGGCRIWKKECLEETGFIVAPSPDAITVALAHIKGWKAITCKNAKVYSREVGDRMLNYKTFGSRAYYRGNTLFFALLKAIHFIFIKGKLKIGIDFLMGYMIDFFKRRPKITNSEVKKYYKNYILNKLIRKY